MKLADVLAQTLGGTNAERISMHFHAAAEIRLRANRPMCLRLLDGSEIMGEKIDAAMLRCVVNRLMDNSMYACENELQQGYFTTAEGCRVGVCGHIHAGRMGVENLSSIGSICIRIPRQAAGCASLLAPHIFKETPSGLLLLSAPGMGKTTVLRELIRLASSAGYNVGVSDERRELAACAEGIPGMDLGMRTDVLDGCPKALGIPMLVRACAPQIIVVDEIGSEQDAQAIADAVRSGVAILASAHAAGLQDALLRRNIARLMVGSIFPYCAVLGPKPGELRDLYYYSNGGLGNAEGYAVVDHTALLCVRRPHVVQCASAAL